MKKFFLPLSVALALPSLGCGADLGMGAGAQAPQGHAVGFARVSGATKLGSPLNDRGIMLGAELESHAEANVGSRSTGGVLAGWGSGPAAIDGTVGLEIYGQLGTQLQTDLFKDLRSYAGGTVAVPIRLSEHRNVSDMNKSFWFAQSRYEFVPFARCRLTLDDPLEAPAVNGTEVAVGMAFRVRLFTDLL